MANKNAILYDSLGNKIAPLTTAEQVITKQDGTETLEQRLESINTALDARELKANKGVANGYAGLDENAQIPLVNMPSVIAHNKGWFADPDALREAHATAESGDYAVVGTTDTVWVWDADTNDWVDTDTKGQVQSVNGKTGVVVLVKADVGLANVDNTSDIDKPISTATQSALDAKVTYGITGDSLYTF